MKTVVRVFLGAALFCATLVCVGPASAASPYTVTLVTSTEPATIVITAREKPGMRVTEALQKNEKKTIAIDAAPYSYEIAVTRCGSTMSKSWTRAGLGLTVIADGCGSLSLLMQR